MNYNEVKNIPQWPIQCKICFLQNNLLIVNRHPSNQTIARNTFVHKSFLYKCTTINILDQSIFLSVKIALIFFTKRFSINGLKSVIKKCMKILTKNAGGDQ